MRLEDWLDDLCVRFLVNLPPEELESVERICFQVEEAQWFYEDFIRPLDPSLPSLTLRAFSLRIFQHCPLFSEWSTETYTAAFAEFLYYKSRVPVRGAIMLNDAMDQVVLVRGWKKGSHWSFPRGKINKDEDDRDCAIREVYEETGFDLRAAGLVGPPAESKSIEVVMREQHMRLFVFRGVPMDTHFEPLTRKEIGKIDWYKLGDLPTIKQNKTQNAGDGLVNNKFYMVAPFMNQLKKWISEQRRLDGKRVPKHNGTHAITEAFAGAPTAVQTKAQTNGGAAVHQYPSDLPEVSHPQIPAQEPALHLKQLLNIGAPPAAPDPGTEKRVDIEKSSSLLALLRNGSRPDVSDVSKPGTPFEAGDSAVEKADSPQHSHPQPAPMFTQPPHPFPNMPMAPRYEEMRPPQPPRQPSQLLPFGLPSPQNINSVNPPGPAPYHVTRDPVFASPSHPSAERSVIPPASALPLNNHARSLLDAFTKPKQTGLPDYSPVPVGPQSNTVHPIANNNMAPDNLSSVLPAFLLDALPGMKNQTPRVNSPADHKANLLGLFQKLTPPLAEMDPTGSTPKPLAALAELSANPALQGQGEKGQPKLSPAFQPDGSVPTARPQSRDERKPRGVTSATISGPLNQPQFDGIVRASRKSTPSNHHARSPVPPNRMLFDPHQSAPKKILTRPVSENSPSVSPKRPKSRQNASSKRPVSRKEDDNTRPFQPQILRRPAAEPTENITPPSTRSLPGPTLSAPKAELPAAKPPAPATNHKQSLLNLFNQPPRTLSPDLASNTNPPTPPHPGPPSASTSISPPNHAYTIPPGIVSPLSDRQPSHSQRRRLDSLTSAFSATGLSQPPSRKTTSAALPLVPQAGTEVGAGMGTGVEMQKTSAARPQERKTTADGDRAFLLGYLGKIASQS